MSNLKLVINNSNKEQNQGYFFEKKELKIILDLYAKMVSEGSWKDYGLSISSKRVSFSIFKNSTENAIYKISKNFKPKHKNLKYSITDTNGKIFSNSGNIETLLKNLSIFKILIFSSLTCFVTFFLILNLCQIHFEDFIYQYIDFPREIGGNRYFSLNYDFKNLFLDFKLIHLIFFTYVSLIFYQLKNKKKFKISINFIVFLFALLILISLIQHQLLTKNQIYIFLETING